MKSFIPKDFNLIAKTEMPGTGGTIVRAYANSEQKIYFTIESRNKDNEAQINAFGPVEQRLLGPLALTIQDVMEMRVMNYINE